MNNVHHIVCKNIYLLYTRKMFDWMKKFLVKYEEMWKKEISC